MMDIESHLDGVIEDLKKDNAELAEANKRIGLLLVQTQQSYEKHMGDALEQMAEGAERMAALFSRAEAAEAREQALLSNNREERVARVEAESLRFRLRDAESKIAIMGGTYDKWELPSNPEEGFRCVALVEVEWRKSYRSNEMQWSFPDDHVMLLLNENNPGVHGFLPLPKKEKKD